MKIAVTYDNGNVFQHFGRTENFKVYTVEDKKVVSSEILGSDGTGHEALAYLLRDRAIDVLICGGIGMGAQNALADAGVELCAGAQGSADEAVEAYLRGELINTGANCNHHDHEHGEGHECGGDCGHGGCGGGCHEHENLGPNSGRTVRVHYTGTFNDGTKFDSSYDRNEPLEFVCGVGMMIPGFDRAVANMKPGEKINIHLMPEEAYGPRDENAVFTIEQSQMPGCETLYAGAMIYLRNEYGQQFPATVVKLEGTTITFDTNHDMAGKELNFEVELLDVR